MKKFEFLTLTAKKVKETEGYWKGFYKTELYLNGILKAIIPAGRRQPRKDKKTIVVNCFRYKLKFE